MSAVWFTLITISILSCTALSDQVPSCGPTNVSAFATTSSSILVRWGEVPEPDRNGLILGYKVVYKEKDSETAPKFWMVEGNTSHSVQLSELGKYVLYEIQVLAFTRIGDGRNSFPSILERTLDDVPGPPVGILFPEVRTTSVRLIWQPPAQPNGIILAYQITYRRNSSNSNAAIVDVLSPSARQYTATGLKAELVYVFRLTAQTRKGWGEAAEALVVTTEKRARPQPTGRPVVPQEEVQARKVLLSWEPGGDGLSPVRYYTVQYRELPDSNWTVHSASVNHEASSYMVDRLKPFTSYQFRVKATNDIGDSEYSEDSEAITTLQDGTVHASPSAELKLERGNCPPFWISFNGRCYKYVPSDLSWNDAEKNCQSQDAHLVSIHSEEEHTFVLNLIQNYNPSLYYNTWIGLNDLYIEGGWMWSDGSYVNYTGWNSDQRQPNGGTGENCVITNCGYPRQWCDLGCSDKAPSVCMLRTQTSC